MNMDSLKSTINEIDNKFNLKLCDYFEGIKHKEGLKKAFLSELRALNFFDTNFKIKNPLHDSNRKELSKLTSVELTPDWILEIDGQQIMIEVYNQNINEKNLEKRNNSTSGNLVILDIIEDRLRKGSLAAKYSKYSNLVKKLEIPYFIFLDVDFLADIDEISLNKFLYGSVYEDLTNEFTSYYRDLSQGLFYNEKTVRFSNYINGFFLLKDGLEYYFHNYQALIPLSEKTKNNFLKFQVNQ